MKINGYSIPVKDLVIIITASFWLSALSFQVSSNADEIEEQKDTKERLVGIERDIENTKDDIGEIQTEQKAQGKEQVIQGKILAQILEAVKKD